MSCGMIDSEVLRKMLEDEEKLFCQVHRKSEELFIAAKASLHNGVPMNWMVRWCSPFPVFVEKAKGGHFTDADGNRYVDFCLGDTGAMSGHAPDITVKAITAQLENGMTYMLPTENAAWVGEELKRRFGLKYWQIAMTATDANRFAIRLCRQVTKRKYVLVFNWCYHGTVDETLITLNSESGKPEPRPGNIGMPVNPTETTKVVEFNDVEALRAALQDRDVACVLAEPVMTNIGIISPEEGFHSALRALTKEYGTLLILDETHTICTGPGGYTKEHHLHPDMITIGKPIAGGFPAAAYGFSEELADRIDRCTERETADVGGIGGTLSANAVALTAMRATLESVLIESSYEKTIPLAKRFTEGVQSVIDEHSMPWSVVQLGCRTEYWFQPTRAKNGGEAAAHCNGDLDRFMHLYCLNRGILMTPFHNMALMCPAHSVEDVDRHTSVFREAVNSLVKGV